MGPDGISLDQSNIQKSVLGCTHMAEQLLFSKFHSTTPLYFEEIEQYSEKKCYLQCLNPTRPQKSPLGPKVKYDPKGQNQKSELMEL